MSKPTSRTVTVFEPIYDEAFQVIGSVLVREDGARDHLIVMAEGPVKQVEVALRDWVRARDEEQRAARERLPPVEAGPDALARESARAGGEVHASNTVTRGTLCGFSQDSVRARRLLVLNSPYRRETTCSACKDALDAVYPAPVHASPLALGTFLSSNQTHVVDPTLPADGPDGTMCGLTPKRVHEAGLVTLPVPRWVEASCRRCKREAARWLTRQEARGGMWVARAEAARNYLVSIAEPFAGHTRRTIAERLADTIGLPRDTFIANVERLRKAQAAEDARKARGAVHKPVHAAVHKTAPRTARVEGRRAPVHPVSSNSSRKVKTQPGGRGGHPRKGRVKRAVGRSGDK